MSKFKFDVILKEFEHTKDEIIDKLADASLDSFVKNFNSASYEKKKWKEVQRNIPGTLANKYSKYVGYPPLVNTGELYYELFNSIKKKKWPEIYIVVDSDYASYHNSGTSKIPKRQFVGHTKQLEKEHMNIIQREIDKLFK